jgi:DNA replicative helicase MCM subunit Mcm2 (Cdc46/Mcm family)
MKHPYQQIPSYDPTKSLAANVNLTSPIMSRFDLFFIVRDSGEDEELDMKVADHILKMHEVAMSDKDIDEMADVNMDGDDGDLKVTQDDLRK